MGLLELKIVMVAVLTAALILFCRSFEDLSSTASSTATTARAQRWSLSFFITAPSSSLSSHGAAAVATTNSTTTTSSTPNFSKNNETFVKESYDLALAPAAGAASPSPKVHKLCVMSRVHNQPRSLAEWLEYHAALGITRFFLVDDCSTDGGRTRTVMDVYQQEGLIKYYTADDVTRNRCAHVIQDTPGEAERVEEWRRQRVCQGEEEDAQVMNETQYDQHMAGCAYMCGGVDGRQHRPNENMLFDFMYQQATTSPDEKCEWLMVFDTDEYMTFATDLFSTPDVPAYIADYEKRTDGFPILRFLWVIMGSDGQEQRPSGLLVDNFRKGTFPKWMLKTAGKVDFLETWRFSHWCVHACVGMEMGVCTR